MGTKPKTTPWDELLELVKTRISTDAFDRWFSALKWLGDDGKSWAIQVPNAIHIFFLESNFSPTIEAALAEIVPGGRKINFVTAELEEKTPQPAPSAEDSEPAAPRKTERPEERRGSPLNPRNTFAAFVVGANNEFAYAAAEAVANAPARKFNPLFIYGASGLGKTHLLHGIGHAVIANKKNAKIAYLTSEQFTNEFIDAIQHKSLAAFRKKYRHADVLMIDDIHFLCGKERSQEEFFHTFNALHDGHKQIVLSSDKPPSEIDNLEQRLVSRFEWGMTAELQPPDMETRIAILRSKAETLHIRVEPWIMEFLADRIRNNVRRLEGAITRVATYQSMNGQSMNGREISKQILENLLRDIFQEQVRKTVSIEQIQKKVAEHYDVRLADMTSKRRPANIAFPRQIAMYLSRELTTASLSEIGESFGGRDHGTVIHANKQVKAQIEKDDRVRTAVEAIANQLQR